MGATVTLVAPDPVTGADVQSGTTSNPLAVSSGSGASAQQVQGNVASGVADDGNPVKIGGVVSTVTPTYANGQRGNYRMGAGGNIFATLVATDGSSVSVSSTAADGTGTSTAVLAVAARTSVFNGTSWDRARGDIYGQWCVPAPSDNAGTGLVPIKSAPAVSSQVFKATAGNLYDINAYSSAACFFVLIDASAAPAGGAAISPVWVMNLAAGQSVSEVFNVAKRFSTGCVALLTTSLTTFTASATGFVSGGIK